MGNALKDLFTDQANAIREGLGDIGKISPADFPARTREIVGLIGGGSVEGVHFVTFMSEDGTEELYKRPVADGDDCADPVTRNLISAPTKASTAQYNYDFAGWATEPNGALNANALKAVTEDRTVYANFAAVLRYYTIRYLDTDGSVLKTESLAYGSMPSYEVEKDGYGFGGWNPALAKVTGDAAYTAKWIENITFATASWADIARISEAGEASSKFAIGETKSFQMGSTTVTVEILAFDHDDLADGSGKAGMTLRTKYIYFGKEDIHTNGSNTCNWSGCALRTSLNSGKHYNEMPDALKDVVKKVSKKTGTYNKNLQTTEDYFWLFSTTELGYVPASTGNYGPNNQGTPYPLFTATTNYSALDEDAKMCTPGGAFSVYWLRTPYYSTTNKKWGTVNQIGGLYEREANFAALGYTSPIIGVVFGFCI